jgi:short-subunit dehydrogenase
VSLLCPYFVQTGIHQSARNRPDADASAMPLTRSQAAAQAFSEKSVISGKVSAQQVAELTFDAIRANRFYIYSETEPLTAAARRMEDIVHQRNPHDPFADVPHVRALLRSRLLG